MRLFGFVFFRGFFGRFGFFVSGFTLVATGLGFAAVIAFLGGFFVVFSAVGVFGGGFFIAGFAVVVRFVRFHIALVGFFAFAGFVVIGILGFVAIVLGFAAVFFIRAVGFAVFSAAVFVGFGFFSGFVAAVFAVGFVVVRFVAGIAGCFVFGRLLVVLVGSSGFAATVTGFFLAVCLFFTGSCFGFTGFHRFAAGAGFAGGDCTAAAGFDIVGIVAGHFLCGHGHGRCDHCRSGRSNNAHVVLG